MATKKQTKRKYIEEDEDEFEQPSRSRREASVAVSRERKFAGEDWFSELDDVKKIPVDGIQKLKHVGRVKVEGSVTKNMGNYESVRVGVSIEMPCVPSQEAAIKMYGHLSNQVDEMITEELDKACGDA